MGAVDQYLRPIASAALAALLVAAGDVSAREVKSLTAGISVNPIVEIQVLPYAKMRYPTAGDWQWTHEGRLIVTVAGMPDPRYEQLIAFHELSEAWMCKHDGVSEKDVDAWDKAHLDADEPGELPRAPYFYQHKAATVFEKQLASQLGVDWKEYEKAIEELGRETGHATTGKILGKPEAGDSITSSGWKNK